MTTRAALWICAAIALGTLIVYSRVYSFDFLTYDDPGHTTQNPHVRIGLTTEGFVWAFTTFTESNWFPVTWLSHMACFQFFGSHAGFHHLVNVLIHALASIALFSFLLTATGSRWPSAFVAAVFAFHPLHVESVAWITERKDVLCALFWFLALRSWVRDSSRTGLGRYLDTAIFFILGLMSKPMIVTFPFVLLLLDAWPLRRPFSRKLITEKWPFFVLSAAACAVTFAAQKTGGAVQSLGLFPLSARLENAALTVWIYIGKTFWPADLALAYPWVLPMPILPAVAAGLGILAVSLLAVRWYSNRPWFAVGWFWFLGTLMPVIGLVQVGPQARADRYMYVPMVGFCIIVAWGAKEILDNQPQLRALAGPVAGALCFALACIAYVQTGYWRTAEAVFRHSLAVTGENELAYTYLGAQLGRTEATWAEAVKDFEAAVRLNPASAIAHVNLANMYAVVGRTAEAVDEYGRALRADPLEPSAHDGLGKILAKTGHVAEALVHFRRVIALDPNNENGRVDAAAAFLKAGQPAEAVSLLQEGIRIDPDHPMVRNLMGVALMSMPNRLDDAIEQFEHAIAIAPEFADAQNNLGIALATSGRPTLAVEHFEEAVRINPRYADAHHNLGLALLRTPDRQAEGVQHLEEAQRLAPDPALRRTLDEIEGKSGR